MDYISIEVDTSSYPTRFPRFKFGDRVEVLLDINGKMIHYGIVCYQTDGFVTCALIGYCCPVTVQVDLVCLYTK